MASDNSSCEELVGEVRAVVGLGQNVLEWTLAHNRAVLAVDVRVMVERLSAALEAYVDEPLTPSEDGP